MSVNEAEQLKAKIEELEQQIAEEREEFEWDLKAARESSAAQVRKLEEELAGAKAAGSGAVGTGDELLTRRALMAERKVAELQQELKRAREESSFPAASADDSLMRQRAESAEQERDKLLREKRSLERTLDEKSRALTRAEDKAGNTADLKRQLEETRRERLAAEREKAKLTEQVVQADERGGAESEQLQKQQEELQAALDENKGFLSHSQARVRELADRVAELEVAEAEVKRLTGRLEIEQEARREIENERNELIADGEASGDAGERMLARQKELERELTDLQDEMARTRMASGQMLEQREREAERLKDDLASAQSEQSTTSGRLESLEAEHLRDRERLERELQIAKQERGEAVEALMRFREAESTLVSKPPVAGQQADPAESPRDPFDEQTQRVPMDQVSVETSGVSPGVDGSDAESPQADRNPVVPGELVATKPALAGTDEFPDARTPDQPVGQNGDSAEFSKGETESGEPPMPTPDEAELARSTDDDMSEEVLDAVADAFARQGDRGLNAAMPTPVEGDEQVVSGELLSPAPGSEPIGALSGDEEDEALEPIGELLDAPDEATDPPALQPEVDDSTEASLAPASEEEGPASAPLLVPDEPAEPIEHTAEVRSLDKTIRDGRPMGGKPAGGSSLTWLWVGLGVLALGGLLVGGALYVFPYWFGTAGVDPDPVSDPKGPDTIASQVDAGVDAGPIGTDDDPIVQPQVEDAGVAESDDDSGAPDVAEPDETPERDPKLAKALNRAQEHGSKLLKRRRHKQALKHLVPWVKRVPDDARLRFLYGRALFLGRKIKPAVYQMEKAVELDPAYVDAWYELGGMCVKNRKKDRAKEAMEKFIELAPDDRRAKAVRGNLKHLR